jgi:hypothetical protein
VANHAADHAGALVEAHVAVDGVPGVVWQHWQYRVGADARADEVAPQPIPRSRLSITSAHHLPM